MAAPGRNDLCPCGSGKKLKRCCGAADRPPDPIERAAALHELDRRLVARILDFGRDRFPDELAAAIGASADPGLGRPQYAQFVFPYLAYIAPFFGEAGTLVDHFLASRGGRLDARERSWLEANRRAWLSVWEVVEIDPERSLRLRDLLTREERVVVERIGTREAKPRMATLARVVDFEGLSLLVGGHPRPMGPLEGDVVVRQARSLLRVRTRRIAPSELGGPYAAVLLRLWDDVLAEVDARPLPTMVNADGDPLVLTEEWFAFDASVRARVENALLAAEGFVSHGVLGPGSDTTVFELREDRRPDHGGWDGTTLGRVEVEAGRLVARTNSERRAALLAARVEAACAGLVRRDGDRVRRDVQDFVASSAGRKPAARAPDEIPAREKARIVREVKSRHYAAWPDMSIPMLGGLTPRQAATKPSSRARLEALLRDIEFRESSEPVESRFDVADLRRRLGMDEPGKRVGRR